MTNKRNNNRASNGSKRKNKGSNRAQVRPTNKQRQPQQKQSAPRVHVSKCASDYARCLINPFDGPLACIPDYPALHTRRVRTFSRGTFATSSGGAAPTGIGFITMSPLRSMYNDGPMGAKSDSLYQGTIIAVNTATAGVTQYKSNSDYAAADFGTASTQVQGRVVSAGLRIKYRGTELNRGGTIFALVEPTHDGLHGSSIDDLAGQADCRKFHVNNQWTNLIYKPSASTDNNFTSTASTSTNDTAASTNYMAFMVQASDPTVACAFEYEAYTVLEFTGRKVRGTLPSHYDPTGFAAVHAVAASSNHRLPSQGDSAPKEKSFLDDIGKYLLEGISWVGNAIGSVVKTAQLVGGAIAAFM